LDLVETRNVIIMESTWNEAVEKQAIGRAVRYGSHSNLREKDRVVDIYKLFLIKPSEREHIRQIVENRLFFIPRPEEEEEEEEETVSVDLYLKSLQAQKQSLIEAFQEKLHQLNTFEQEL
jgi:SNF2 family DNA or RNA helicase